MGQDSERLALYFAYGSNMPRARLQARVGAVRLLGVGRLRGHRLSFRKRGADGSGKCDVVASTSGADTVHGVVFVLDGPQMESLHGFEGCGYECVRLPVQTATGVREVFTYRALPAHTDGSLLPFDWYLALVLAGAAEHKLPLGYRERLARLRTVPDPDTARAAAHRQLLAQT